ncbi:glutamate receptor ionotropic, kainate 2-like [Panulirus ornatus]|uniref:glutamate receptor ionotropic, kainate 2-like n=1 Tax=Panulirus ornatus TaxID=150431 RepID=UPI003A89D9B5
MLEVLGIAWLLLFLSAVLPLNNTLVGFPLTPTDPSVPSGDLTTTTEPDLTSSWLHTLQTKQINRPPLPTWENASVIPIRNRFSRKPVILSHKKARGKELLSSGHFSRTAVEEEEENLAIMMRTFVNRELRDCSLLVVADGGYIGSSALRDLVRLPNAKQVVHMRTQDDLQGVVWEAPGCRGYVFLLQDPTPLLLFADTSPFLWDYDGRYVLVGASREQLEDLTLTQKGRKTEHIVGVVESGRGGEWLVYMNQLYWGPGVALTATWSRHGFTSHYTPFPDKTSDLLGAVLKVVTFEWEPSTLYHRAKNGSVTHLFGRDVDVVRALAPIFNFSVQFIEPPNGERWGSRLNNGSWSGIVGMLGRGDADAAIANLFVNTLMGRDQFQGYSSFFDTDESCIMIRTEPPLPRWQSPGLPYRMETWLAILMGLILSGPVIWLVARVASVEDEIQELLTLESAYSNALRMHMQECLPRLPRRQSTRVLVGFLLLYTIILRTGYSSNLTAFLTVVRRPSGIDTMKELYESHLVLFEASTFLRDSLRQSPNPYLRGLARRHVVVKDMPGIIREIAKGRGVFIQNRSAMEFLTNTLLGPFRKAFGVRMLKECYSTFNVAVGLPRNSPLKSRFDRVIGWIFESGLVRHWKQESYAVYKKNKEEVKGEDANVSNTLVAIVAGDLGGTGGLVPLSLDHMQSVFYGLLFCFVVSAITFLYEVAFSRRM